MKKKAIKIATASVVAASSFAAVAPFSTEAASSVPSTVAKAVKSMKAAKTAYKSLGDKGKVASVASVQKAVNQAKADYSKAKAALAKYKGKDKSKLNKQLMAAMKDYHNATDYIKAVNYASGLKKQADSFAAAAKAGKSINASDYAKFKAELAKATKKVMDQIVGLADKAVVKAYITPALAAQKTVDSYLATAKSVDEVKAIEVNEGTKLEDVNLPKVVTVTLNSGKKVEKEVKWDTKDLEANLNKPGEYTVKGEVTGTKLEASVKVTVNAVNPKVESVSAINSKSIKVTFSKSVDDTKAAFAVTKDSFKVNVATTTWNADKTEATLELTSKLSAGTYAVSVTGLTDSALTGSVVAQDEKVTGIEILSDKAPLSGANATVGYKVVNQYGEDLTKLEDVEVSLAGAKLVSASAGTLTFTKVDGASDLKAGDTVVATIIHKGSATATSKTLTVSAAAKASEVAFGTLYNKDGKTLNEDTNLSVDKFYLPLEVKDQYGNVITDAKKIVKDDLFITNTNAGAVSVDLANLTTIKIGDKDTLVLPLNAPSGKTNAVAGDSTITVIAAASGKNTQSAVKVAEATRTDEVKFGPATVFAGEETLVPVTVKDKNGNEITDLKVLKDTVKGLKITSSVDKTADELIQKDGALFIKVAPLKNKNDVHTIVVQTSTNKVATVTLTAKEAIAPKVITGLKVSTSVREKANSNVVISKDDITVEDQYGQVISADNLLAKLGDNYKIIAEAVDGAPFTVSGEITNAGGNITVTYKAGQDRTSAKVTFKLAKKDDKGVFQKVETSAYAKEFSVVKDSAFASYKVADIAPIYVKGTVGNYTIPNGYGKDIVVKAVTSSGEQVTLDAGSDYTVKSTVLTSVDKGHIERDAAKGIEFAKDATTTTAKVTITINATGEEIVKEVTFSNVAPKVAKVEAVKNNTVVDKDTGIAKTIDEADTLTAADLSQTYSTAAAFDLKALKSLVDFVVTDTYGVRVALDEKDNSVTLADGSGSIAPTVTLSKVSGDVVFSSNGTIGASVVEIPANSVFNARLNVNGVAGTTLKVTATEAYSKSKDDAAQKAVNEEAAKVANTLSVKLGDTTLPSPSDGYTIKVKTTSDDTVYDSTGKGLKAGTSTVVYTVTNTASGKTADTANVTVTVAP